MLKRKVPRKHTSNTPKSYLGIFSTALVTWFCFNHAPKACPTSREVEETFGTQTNIRKIWEDKLCASGCFLKECVTKNVPCCVVTRSRGLSNAFRHICTRQVDNYLFSQQKRYGERALVQYCKDYLSLRLESPNCYATNVSRIPATLYTIGPTKHSPTGAKLALLFDDDLRHFHVDDNLGYEFILENCSLDLAKAYSCIKPPAFRADLYRFCALYAHGGIYMDMDIVPLVSLWRIVSQCSSFTLGYDQAQKVYDVKHIGMQMKVLAAEPGHPISRCMLDSIFTHVKHRRSYTKNILLFSGPQLLKECYERYPSDVAITYIDTRGADWPYAGLRANSTILAYENPVGSRHFKEISEPDKRSEYADLAKKNDIYREDCEL